MSTRLEEELAAGMCERVTHLRPRDDLVARAAHRNHRRRARLAAGCAAVGVSAVLVVTVAGLNGGTARTGPTGAAGATGATPQLLTAVQVAQRAAAALAADDIKYAVVTTTYDARTVRTELWQDPATGNSRRSGVNYPGGPEEDSWVTFGESEVVVTQVNHTARTWTRFERPGPIDLPSDWTLDTPEKLRQALLDGGRAYELVGPEEIDGRAVVHLRSTIKGGGEDLWVDAQSYRPVRLVVVKPGDGRNMRRQEDIQWLRRDAESLAPLTVAIPAGFARIDVSVMATPSPR
jgi:hypothetical protein